MRTRPKIETLLAEDAWIRRMAKRLVTDPNLADDLAQDAWVVALGSSSAGSLARPWLGGVLRNLVRSRLRSRRRRARRESNAAGEEAWPSAAEIVDEVALRRTVAEAVLELEEPYRSTLYLRFFRDLTPGMIARRTGVPPSTVHDRVRRGLEMMRRRLDHVHRGDRRAWSLAMLPLTRSLDGLTTVATGGILMSTGIKMAASALLVAGAVSLGIWIQKSDGDTSLATPSVDSDPVPEALVIPTLPPPELVAESGTPTRVEVVPEETASPVEAEGIVEEEAKTLTLHGRVIDVSDRPIAAIRVGFRTRGKTIASARTDGGGRFSIERPAPPPSDLSPLFAKLSGGALVVEDSPYTVLATGTREEDGLVVVVAPRVDAAGKVVDEAEEPIENAYVAVRVRQDLYHDLGLAQFVSAENTWLTRTDPFGAFTLRDVGGGEHLFLDVIHFAYAPANLDLPETGGHDLVIVLTRTEGAIDVHGRVIDDAGDVVPRAGVSMGNSIVFTDDDGRFTLHWDPRQASRFRGFWEQDEPWTPADGEAAGPLQITAARPGYVPARRELELPDLYSPIVLRMGGPPLEISGTVRDEAGAPRAGVVVWASDLTPFGKRLLREGEDSTTLPVTVEEVVRGGMGERGTVSDDDGDFTLGGLMDRRYRLALYDPNSATHGEPTTVAAGRSGVDLVLKRDPSTERVAGRIVSATGVPVPGVSLHVVRAASLGEDASQPEPPESLVRDRTTDEEGRFEFPALAVEGTTLRLVGERIFFQFVRLDAFDDLARLEIVAPLLCEFQLLFEDDPEFAGDLRILNEADQPLSCVVSYGSLGNTITPNLKIEKGRTRVLRVPETARTLVVIEDGFEILRESLRLNLHRRTVVRF